MTTRAVGATGGKELSHGGLCLLAEAWLWRQGCSLAVHDGFKAITDHGECPDAIGWRGGVSLLVECKLSRGDFLADRSKPFRADPARGMGDWRFYLSPPGIIAVADLPHGWGLLHAKGGRISAIHGVPGNTGWRATAPFVGNKLCETQVLVSALRRMVLRGHLPDVYAPLIGQASLSRAIKTHAATA